MERQQRERSSNLELMRVIAMVMIVLCHTVRWGGEYVLSQQSNALLSAIVCACKYLGEIGNALFILLAGYFLLRGSFRIRKLLRLVLETSLYTLLIFFILLAVGRSAFSTAQYLQAFFPLFTNMFWFFTAYFIFYLLSPFLRNMLSNCSRRQLLGFIGLLALFLCLMQLNQYDHFCIRMIGFLEVAMVGGYIARFDMPWMQRWKRFAWIGCIWLVVLLLLAAALSLLGQPTGHPGAGYFFCRFYSLLVLPLCVCLFLAFRGIPMRQHPKINWVAGSVFGIYLLHDNIFYRTTVLLDIFGAFYGGTILGFVLVALVVATLEFVVCLFLDKLQKVCIENPLFRTKWITGSHLLTKIDNLANRIAHW